MKTIAIKNIYDGKPDAKDEAIFNGVDSLIKALIVPATFDIDGIINREKFVITGLKGTGKTALLFYLDEYLHQTYSDHFVHTSAVFFNSEYSSFHKMQLEKLNKQIISSIALDSDVLLNGIEYDYIWKWILYTRICADNEAFNNLLFVNDGNWKAFYDLIHRIATPNHDNWKIVIPKKIKLTTEVKVSSTSIKPEIEVDLSNLTDSKNLSKFCSLIDEAEQAFSSVRRTNVPYFLFIDELDVYFGNENVFQRDLHMVRDLIITVKNLNSQFVSISPDNVQTKIVCLVRTEVINAISRLLISRDVNKAIEGFVAPVVWNYANTNSYQHPIIQILLKRIMIAEEEISQDPGEVYSRWFPDTINGIDPCSYILNNSWNRPRDMVRLILAAKNGMLQGEHAFTQAVFDSLRKDYSNSSLTEMRVEMNALYSTDDVSRIIKCFEGSKNVSSYEALKAKLSEKNPNSRLSKDPDEVLKDLYRIGFIGNYSPKTKKYRWCHKGDNEIILSPEWDIMVHRALYPALSITIDTSNPVSKESSKPLMPGQEVDAIILRVVRNRVIVHIQHAGKEFPGSFKIKKNMYLDDNRTVLRFSENETIPVRLVSFNKQYNSWDVKVNWAKES